jgi:succinate dehydrogenase / fumarate reductase, iron-sulfur subunit
MSDTIRLKLKVWRQDGPTSPGRFETHELDGISEHISFLEMLDMLNQRLITEGKTPITFEHDCREGICGSCGFAINGQPHGPDPGTTVCQLHMRTFKTGETLVLEPWRARAFPVMKDLQVDRNAFERIQAAGGYNSVNCGNAPDGNSVPVGREDASQAFDAAACIGCGACVAACKNGSASLFTSAKIGHFAMLPQGAPERDRRALRMVVQMDEEGFGSCTNTLECEAACPKDISVRWIQRMNRDYLSAALRGKRA